MSRMRNSSRWVASACLLLALALSPVAAGQVVSGQVVATGIASMETVRVELQALPTPHERVRILMPDAEDTPPLSVVRPHSDGRFSLQAPGPGMYRVVVRAAGRMPMTRDLTPLLGDLELPPVDPPVERVAPVRVVAPDGTAIGGAALALRQGHGDVWLPERRRGWHPLRRTVSADAAGRAAVPIAEGEERLVIGGGAPGWWGARVEGRAGEPLELVLQPGVERLIEVRREGRPAARAALWVTGPARQAVLADEAGVARVTLPDGEPAEIWVETEDGWRGRYEVRVEAHAEGAAPMPPLRLVLRPPAHLAGRVVGAGGGEPIAGALVWLRSEEGSAMVAGDDGRFVYPVAGSAAVEVLAAAAAFEPESLTLEVDEWPRAGDGLVLPLTPRGVVAGTVLDSSGWPLPGATVLLRRHRPLDAADWHPSDPEVETVEVDEEGRFRFADLPRLGSLQLRAEAPDRAPAELEAKAGDREIRFVLGHGGSLRARVRSSDGGAITGASARLFATRPGPPVAHYDHGVRLGGLPAELAEDGVLRLERAPAGTHELVVEMPGHRPLTVRGIEIADGAETDLGTLELEPETVLVGRVVDLEGRPVAGATLEVEQAEPSSGSSRGHRGRRVEVDEAGRFRVGGLTDRRPLDLAVRAEGYLGTGLSDIQLPLGEPLEVRLGRGGTVFGQVVDEVGRPLAREYLVARLAPNAAIPHRPASGAASATDTSDEDGRFELTAVPVGPVTITASRVQMTRDEMPVTMIREGERVGPLRIEVPASAEITGRVLRADGSPAAGAQVAAVREVPRHRSQISGPPADALGRFRIQRVQPGPVRVVATLGVTGRAEKELIAVGGVVEVELVLEPTTAVAGRMVTADGAPVGRGVVRLVREGIDLHLPVDQAGRFELVGLDEGTYRLVAEVPGVGRGAHPEPIEVRRGRPVEGLVVRLGEGAQVSGRLIGLAEVDLAHVDIYAGPQAGGMVSPGLVRPDGSFEIRGLGPGRYSLHAAVRSTGQVERTSFEVEAGARLDGLEIDFSGVTLTVTASVLGRPLDQRAWLDGAGVMGTIGARRLRAGHFAFAGLEPGRYRFAILASAAGPRLFRDVEVAGADEEVVLDFEAWPVAGSALDEAGEPVPGVVVWVVEPGEEFPSQRSWSQGLPIDAAGRFELPAVPAGTWRVVAGGGPWQGEALVEVPPGGTAGVAVTLRRREPDAATRALP